MKYFISVLEKKHDLWEWKLNSLVIIVDTTTK